MITFKNFIIDQAAVQNPSTAAAVPLPLTREVRARSERRTNPPNPPCKRGEGHRSGGGILLAALLLALALLPLPCLGSAADARPTLEQFTLGFDALAEQLREGHGLNTLFAVSLGYLPVADRDAANALRQMFTVAQFGYMQRGVGEECEQSLQIWAAGESALSLTHRAQGNRRHWSSPQLLPQGISTPMEINLFAELIGQAALGEMVFALPPGSAVENTEGLLALQRLLDAAGESDFALAPEVANRTLDIWRKDPAYGPLINALFSGWRVTAAVRISHKLDEQGGLASFQLNTQVVGSDGRVWNLECKGSQGPGRRQHTRKLNVTLSRDKSNTLRLAATVTTTEQAKDHLRQTVRLTCNGKLNGHTMELRLNGTLHNRFLAEGAALVERIEGNYTLDWKTREPKLARLGLDDWKVTLGVKGALRPALFEGNLSLALTRSRRDFLSTGIAFRAGAGEHPTGEEPSAAQMWDKLGDEEQEQLDVLRTLMRRQIAGKLMVSLDEGTRNGIWLK